MSTILFLCFLLVTIVLVLSWLLRGSKSPAATVPAKPPLVIDDRPDRPMGFGYKMLWLAIRSDDSRSVVEALGLRDVVPANWRSGVDAAYRSQERRVFVTPVVSGWVLCAGFALPTLDLPAELSAWKAFMEKLAARFPDVQFFGNHRVSSYAAWGRYQEGRLVRAYAAADEPSINEGEKTREEIELGFDFATPENPEGDTPDEDDVMALAAAWSLDPNELAQSGLESGAGWVGSWGAPAPG